MEENQNPLKHRLSRVFRSSFGSCKSKNISDVITRPVLGPHNRQHYQLIDLFSPKPTPFPSICRPKCSETDLFPRPKVSDRNSLLGPTRKPPTSPLTKFFDSQQPDPNPRQKKPKKRTHLRKRSNLESFNNYYDWFSSDDDDNETTLFSSKSLSSDSSNSFRRKKPDSRPRRAPKGESEVGLKPLKGKVKDSFAVVKRSSDPYSDFRISMVEMIVEKQIFGARELQNLLQTFLTLNSYHHHKVIAQVFTEILETLFSDLS